MKVRFRQEKEVNPDREDGVKVKYGPSKKDLPKIRWYGLLFIVSTPILYFAFSLISGYILVEAPGHIFYPTLDVRARANGTVASIEVELNQLVAKDDLLIRLRDDLLSRNKLVVVNELQALDNSFLEKKLKHSNTSKIQERISQTLKELKELVDMRREQFESLQYLTKYGAATQSELATAKVKMMQANMEHDSFLVRGSQTRYLELNAELTMLNTQLSRLTEYSLSTGQILDVYVAEGENVASGSPLLKMATKNEVEVLAFVKPENVKYAHTGKTATVSLSSGESFTATVVNAPNLTSRVPTDFAGPLGARPSGVLTLLKPDEVLDPSFRIHGLPVSIRFHY